MEEKLMTHVGNYSHIYRFVCENSRTLDEIKDFLVGSDENASTVKTHMQMLSGEKAGMFRVNGNMVSVDSVMARELVAEVNEIFEPLLMTDTERSAEMKRLIAENEKLKKQLEGYKKKAVETKKLDKKKVEASKLVFPKVLIIDSVQVGPIDNAKDKVLLDTRAYSIELSDYLAKYGMLKDSFYRELDEEHNLTQGNYKRKTFKDVFCDSWLGRRLEELGIIKAKLSKETLSVKEDMKENFHISEKEAQMQIQYLTGRALAVQEILANQKLTNQEKIALYVFNSPYRNTDLERLLNFAGDECIDANWLITLLEAPELCGNYESVRDLIRQCSKASEWAMKKRLAEELIAGEWFITANYCGSETKFQLVPIEELNEIRSLLGVDAKDFEFVLDTPKKEPVPIEEVLVKKGSFLKTVPVESDEEIEEALASCEGVNK